MSSYADYYALAMVGAASLSSITDAISASSPLGTDCDADYWNAHAYDQIAKILLELGPTPGSGSTGSWTVNSDNATSNAEDSYLNFSRGTAEGGDSSLMWDASVNSFVFSHPLLGGINHLGSAVSPWVKAWATDVDIADELNVEGAVTVGADGTLDVLGDATFADVDVTGTLTVDALDFEGVTLTLNSDAVAGATTTIAVHRGQYDTAAGLRWNETTDKWQAYSTVEADWYDVVDLADTEVITDAMLASSIYDGTGTATTLSRSDHSHEGGVLEATGTIAETFTLDSDYSSGSVNIDLRFSGSSYYIRQDPSDSGFQFSHGLRPVTHNVDNLGSASRSWHDLHLSNDANIGGDLSVTGTATLGAVSDNLAVNGSYVTVDSDSSGYDGCGGLRVMIDYGVGGVDEDWAEVYFNGTNWRICENGTDFYTIATTSSTQSFSNKTLTSPTLSGSFIGALSQTGDTLYLDALGTAGSGAIAVPVGVSHATLGFASGDWRLSRTGAGTEVLATTTAAQTLTNKTLTNPNISGGSWSGLPTFHGDPSFVGSPVFVAETFNKARFNTDAGIAPFTVTVAGAGAPTTVANLSAEKVGGVAVTDILHATTPGADYVLDRNLDVGSFSVTGVTADAHASTHVYGGADALTGNLAVSGTTSQTLRVGALVSNADVNLYLGFSSSFKTSIVSASGIKKMGLGGEAVHVVPGHGTGQHLGYDGFQWTKAWLKEQLNFTPIEGVAPTTNLQNGSLWVVDNSAINNFRSAVKVRLGGATQSIIDSTNKTDIVGANAGWAAGGDVSVPAGSQLNLNGGSDQTGFVFSAGSVKLYVGGVVKETWNA